MAGQRPCFPVTELEGPGQPLRPFLGGKAVERVTHRFPSASRLRSAASGPQWASSRKRGPSKP